MVGLLALGDVRGRRLILATDRAVVVVDVRQGHVEILRRDFLDGLEDPQGQVRRDVETAVDVSTAYHPFFPPPVPDPSDTRTLRGLPPGDRFSSPFPTKQPGYFVGLKPKVPGAHKITGLFCGRLLISWPVPRESPGRSDDRRIRRSYP